MWPPHLHVYYIYHKRLPVWRLFRFLTPVTASASKTHQVLKEKLGPARTSSATLSPAVNITRGRKSCWEPREGRGKGVAPGMLCNVKSSLFNVYRTVGPCVLSFAICEALCADCVRSSHWGRGRSDGQLVAETYFLTISHMPEFNNFK